MHESATIACLGQALPADCGVCVINLDHRTDRWEEFRRDMLPQLEPLEVLRVSAVEGIKLPGFGDPPYFRGRPRDRTWAARAGCTLSHRAALLKAREAGWGRVLVLEDDTHVPQPTAGGMLYQLHAALKAHDPDICYLGFTDPVPPFRELAALGREHGLHQVFGCNTAHAYLVSQRGIARLLTLLPEPRHIWRWLARARAVDRFYYRNLSPNLIVTAVSPTIIDQKPGFSDIMGKTIGAYSENHCTAVEPRNPSPESYAADISTRAAAFARAGVIDHFRGFFRSLRGF